MRTGPSRDLPERGRIAIFNRSYYEEVLVVRVHPAILEREAIPDAPHRDKKLWRERYRSINDFERHLHANGTRIVKLFLHLSKQEQRTRFLRAHRRSCQELEIQRRGSERAQILGRIRGGLRGMPRCNEHRRGALVCRSRRRQGKCPADRFASLARHVRRNGNEISENKCQAGAGIAGDPN